MSLRTDLLPAIDSIRAIPGDLGVHQFTVTRLTRTYTSGTVGRGAYTEASEVLRVGGQNVHARQSTDDAIKQLLGSGALFREGEWIVGPMTPNFDTGGYLASGFDSATGAAVQIFYKIEGPGLPTGGTLFRARTKSHDHPFRLTLILEPAAKAPVP